MESLSSHKKSYATRFRRHVKDISKIYQIISDIPTKKRNYEDSFGNRNYDIERYGQEIDNDFFKYNIGHAVII